MKLEPYVFCVQFQIDFRIFQAKNMRTNEFTMHFLFLSIQLFAAGANTYYT